jgi:hypothetical protein
MQHLTALQPLQLQLPAVHVLTLACMASRCLSLLVMAPANSIQKLSLGMSCMYRQKSC